jgi:hypothetical protein
MGVALLATVAACACVRSPSEWTFAERTATMVSRSEIEAIANQPDTAVAYDSVARVVAVNNAMNPLPIDTVESGTSKRERSACVRR